MIKLKPFVRLGYAPDVIFAMTEETVRRLPLDFDPLLRALQAPDFDPQGLSDADLDRLRVLDQLNLVYNTTGEHPGTVDMYELINWRESYVLGQLQHHRVKIDSFHRDETWAQRLGAGLTQLGFTIVVDKPTVTITVLERLNQLAGMPTPAIPVKIGSYHMTVGPLLTPMFPAGRLAEVVTSNKRFFEEESFLVENLPEPVRALAVSLAVSELSNTLIQVGATDVMKSTVDWNLVTLRRSVWNY